MSWKYQDEWKPFELLHYLNGKNTVKIHSDLRRLVVTQTPVKNPHLTLMKKSLTEYTTTTTTIIIIGMKKRGKKRIASIEDSVDASIQRLEDYIGKQKGGRFTAIRNNTDNTIVNGMTITWKQK